ncbi:MAG TPA: hypothetical protein VKP30_22945 [Polyangiaceae bacterium]|nr:hypothetical protein [Polyangiaceae bacterium]
MRRLVLSVLFLFSACSKTNASGPSEVAPSANAPTVAAPAISASSASASANPAQDTWYAGTWKGEATVSKRPSATSTKEGGPAAWDKDDGQKFAGPINAEITIDAQGEVSGSLKGALGDLGLRGKVEANELRANLVPKSDDIAAIQNGYLVLTRNTDSLTGRLSAATGNALMLRHADLVVKKVAP